jgi:hypothetical protein
MHITFIPSKSKKITPDLVDHACNPISLGGGDQKMEFKGQARQS